MSTDAKGQGGPVALKRKRRRIPSDLERMAKKVNEMRVANNDERLVIVNTICNVESNDALNKFMTIDGHVLLATWLNQALSQGHTALQVALLRLAARLPISGNMSTAIEATVSELALKCSVTEIRDLARSALSEWQNEKPDPRRYSVTIGQNNRRVVFEHDPDYCSSGDEEQAPKKVRSSRKSLQWAPEHKLEMVRVFHQAPEETPASSSSAKSPTPQIEPQTPWSCPPSLLIPEACIVRERASQSAEVEAQTSRTAGLMEIVYFKKDQIPPNPAPPPVQSVSNKVPFTADFRNLTPPTGGMKTSPDPNSSISLDSSESALTLDELISADPGLMDDLLENSELGLGPVENHQFGFGRIHSPPPPLRRDRPRSPPPMDSNFDTFGLPLPPSPPRVDWRYHHAPHRPYLPPPDRPAVDPYGRPIYRDAPPYHFEHDQRRRSPPRTIAPYGPSHAAQYAEFGGIPPQQSRFETFRGYPEHRFPSRFAERPGDFRDRPPSPFRNEMYPPRPQDERRNGRLCKFYQMARGCTLGDSCTFLHENPVGNKPPSGPGKTGSHRSRQRSRNKGKGAAAVAPEASNSIEPLVEDELGDFDQFGRLKKSAASSVAPPAPPPAQ